MLVIKVMIYFNYLPLKSWLLKRLQIFKNLLSKINQCQIVS